MSRVTSSSSAGNITIQPVNPGTNATYTYNEVTNVVADLETTIVTYTAPSISGAFLQYVEASGGNIGEIRIYVNSSIIDKKYLYYTSFNLDFDYKTDVSGSPGFSLSTGDIVTVKGLNHSIGTCSFNAKIQILEVT